MTFNYTVPNGKNHAPIRLYAVQGEAGARTFRLSLGVGQTDTSQTFVYVAKNDGTVCVIDAMYNGDIVTFTLPLQACTCPGLQKVYIQFLGTEVDLRWNNLELWVQPCDIENAVASTDWTCTPWRDFPASFPATGGLRPSTRRITPTAWTWQWI